MNSGEKYSVRIGEAAGVLGVTARYLRKLEAQGSIPPAKRDAHAFRLYSESDIALLRRVGVGSRPRKLKQAEEVLGAGV